VLKTLDPLVFQWTIWIYEESIMKKWLSCLAIVALLAGCNTIHGIGKDIEKGGEAIQKAVK